MSNRPARSLRPPSALREIPGPRDFVQREPSRRRQQRGWSASLAALGGGVVGMTLGAAAMLLSQRFVGEDAAVRAVDVAIVLDVAALVGAVLLPAAAAALIVCLIRLRRARRQAALLAAADDAMPEAILIAGPRGERVAANSAFATLVGIADPAAAEGGKRRARTAAMDADGLPALDRLRESLCRAEEDIAAFEGLRATVAAGRAGSIPIHRHEARGGSVWIELSARSVPDKAGRSLWVARDVTEQRQSVDRLREELRKLADFLESAPLGFYSVDSEGRFLFVNRTLADLLGLTPDDIADGKWRLHDFLVESPARGTPPHSPFASAAAAERGETVLRGAGGRPIQVQIAQSIVQGWEPGTLMTRSVVRDLRPEREWEQALRASELRFQRFFEEAPVGVVLLDRALRISETNPAFAGLIGRERAELVGMPFVQLVGTTDQTEVAAQLAAALNGRSGVTPVEMPLAGGGERTCTLYARSLEGGSAGGLMVHLVETTHQKRLEVQFAQSQKMLAVGQLAGGIAHDFNNLLTAMIGFCDLLLLRHQPGDASFADIMQIKQNANRAANLVRQLLAFSRQQTLQPRVLNLTDTLAELSNLLRRLIGASIELSMQHGRNLGLVRVDQIQFEQVIMNLAVNGRDAMPNGGVLTIRTSNVNMPVDRVMGRETVLAGDYVLIEVIDTGMGIPKENLDRIFEPFFSTKEVGSGTGLGLSTVYGIVRQTDGYIVVDSEPGEGAHFSIYLPQYKGEATAAGAARIETASADLTGKGTVLIVEDEDPVRLFSARALRNKGYKVLEARSGDMALQVLESAPEQVDVVVTDVVMPRMDGPTLIGKLREQRPEIRIICISGYAEGAFREKLASFPDIHFLPKPFSLQQLASKVKEVMSEGA